MRAAKQTLPGAAIRHSNAGHSAEMSTHTIHLDIVYARLMDASGEAVLTLPRTLVATHQGLAAIFSAVACLWFIACQRMGVATPALILYFLLALTCALFTTAILTQVTARKLMSARLLARVLLWVLVFITFYLVLMTL